MNKPVRRTMPALPAQARQNCPITRPRFLHPQVGQYQNSRSTATNQTADQLDLWFNPRRKHPPCILAGNSSVRPLQHLKQIVDRYQRPDLAHVNGNTASCGKALLKAISQLWIGRIHGARR
jgi:hypothetical protein